MGNLSWPARSAAVWALLLCGAWWLRPAWALRLDGPALVGGPGGSRFVTIVPSGARLVELLVFAGDRIDAVQLVYRLEDGGRASISGRKHGGEGGDRAVFRLDEDEFVTGISGRYGQFLDSLQIHTNKRDSPRYGGAGGSVDYDMRVPPGFRFVGLQGRSGAHIDAIAAIYDATRSGMPPGFGTVSPPGPGAGVAEFFGGPGGQYFQDPALAAGTRVAALRVRAGAWIDAIQLVWSGPDGQEYPLVQHGGNGGSPHTFRLEPGEFITALSGRYGHYVDSVQIHTNRRDSPVYGGPGGSVAYRIEAPPERQIAGLAGRSGIYLDAIGAVFGALSAPAPWTGVITPGQGSGPQQVIAAHSGKCIDVAEVSRAPGAPVHQWDCLGHGQHNQLWRLRPVGDNSYQIVAAHSGYCLDVEGGSLRDGAPVLQWQCMGPKHWNQVWLLRPLAGYFQIIAAHSGRCLEVADAAADNGAALRQGACLGAAQRHQLFSFREPPE